MKAVRDTGSGGQRGAGVAGGEGGVGGEQLKLQVDSLGRRIARAQRQIAGTAEHGRWGRLR